MVGSHPFVSSILGKKHLSLGNIYRLLENTFYYGPFEYPRGSGNWHQGKHKPLITQDLFEKAKAQLKRDNIQRESKEFAFTKLITCGYCGSGISAEDKYKQLKDGTTAHYIYYGCSRARDRFCKNKYIREEELIIELLKIIDKVDINELGMKVKLEAEVERFNKFQNMILQDKNHKRRAKPAVDMRVYAKYVLKEGSAIEKRELLANLKSKIILKDKTVKLTEQIF